MSDNFVWLSNVVKWGRLINLGSIHLSLAKWVCAYSMWKQVWLLHCWMVNTGKELTHSKHLGQGTQDPSGAERPEPERRLQLAGSELDLSHNTEESKKRCLGILWISWSHQLPSLDPLQHALGPCLFCFQSSGYHLPLLTYPVYILLLFVDVVHHSSHHLKCLIWFIVPSVPWLGQRGCLLSRGQNFSKCLLWVILCKRIFSGQVSLGAAIYLISL